MESKILIGSGVEKRGLIKAVWESSTVQQAVGQAFIFDGNKLGWLVSTSPMLPYRWLNFLQVTTKARQPQNAS